MVYQNLQVEEMQFKELNDLEIYELFQSLKNKQSYGWDSLPNFVIKKCKFEPLQPVKFIINHCIRNKHFPEEWKISRIKPLYKKSNPEDPGNYRPISLLPCLSKIAEMAIEKQIRQHLEKNSILTSNQFGFRPNHKTQDAILKTINYITNKGSSRGPAEPCILVLADLQKAFDTVDFEILLSKLRHYGIDNKLIESYLIGRKQYVDIDGACSNKLISKVGVPQGGILSPILFAIYINDLVHASDMHTILFADDTSLLLKEQNQEELIKKTNEQLKKIASWFNANGLTLHKSKTTFMAFNTKNPEYFNDKIILLEHKLQRIGTRAESKSTKFVGIHLDDKLSWTCHIDFISKKVAQNLFLIQANKHFLPLKIRLLLYHAVIACYFNYVNVIWGYGNIKKLEKIQKKAIRATVRATPISHTNLIYASLRIFKIKELIKINTLQMAQSILHGPTPKSLEKLLYFKKYSRTTRESENLEIESQNTKNQTLNNAVKWWRELPQFCREISNKIHFIFRIKEFFLNTYLNETPCTTQNCKSCEALHKINLPNMSILFFDQDINNIPSLNNISISFGSSPM